MTKVLVVEDERIVAKDLERTLKRLGYGVPATACSADDAIRKAEEHRPDLVLMDINLEGARDGIAAAAEMRDRLSIPVVYLTAYADDDTVARARETEPFGYLVKPFNERELRSTVEVALYKHRAEARLRMNDRMISIGAMAAGIAHEINNPLAFVTANLGFVSDRLARTLWALRGAEDATGATAAPLAWLHEASKAAIEASEGAERVRRIVGDLKAFTRPDEATREPVDLWTALETALRLSWNQIHHRAAVVRERGPVPRVFANLARLEQVFINLLVNSAQAIPEHSERSNEIRVTTRTDPAGRAIVEIADTGSGIAPEHVARIFDPFFTTKPVGLGTGLGLSICQTIITEIGGEITAESPGGRGALFRISLPPAGSAHDERAVPPVQTPPPAARSRILAIDDEPLLRSLFARILGDTHEVTTLASGVEALGRISDGERFDLVLCDLMMPGMNGMDLFHAVQALAPDQAERFVFLTGGAVSTTSARFVEANAHRLLTKPFTSDQLAHLVDARLAQKG